MPSTLLHLTSPGEWREALRTGVVAPPSLAAAGFVHLSTAAQVRLPADRLFADRRDLLLLAVDAGGLDVRWEPGVHGDPESMRFPHAYGPIPTAAVLAVTAYRPGPDGFADPPEPPVRADHAARARALADSLPRRLATEEVPVTGGIAVRHTGIPWVDRLRVDDGTPARVIAAEADRVLGRQALVTFRGPDPGPVARELGRSGWSVQHDVVLVRPVRPEPGPAAEEATLADVRRVWTDAGLPDRYRIDDRGIDVRPLAVRDGEVVAAAVLQIDGATALLEAVETLPAHRRRGHADALLRGAGTIAARAGCDLLVLHADAAGRARDWCTRRGFRIVDESWSARRA